MFEVRLVAQALISPSSPGRKGRRRGCVYCSYHYFPIHSFVSISCFVGKQDHGSGNFVEILYTGSRVSIQNSPY